VRVVLSGVGVVADLWAGQSVTEGARIDGYSEFTGKGASVGEEDGQFRRSSPVYLLGV